MDEVWYLDSGASNHMTSHNDWFSYLEKSKNPGVVTTGDDTPHPIANIGEVPLSCVGQKGKLMNVLHVPMIMQNLVSIGQIVDQGMQVRFTHLGAFIEQEGRIIARGRTEGRMFILDRTDDGLDTALFAKGQKTKLDIDLWHRRIGHVNFWRLQDLQTRKVVVGLPKFSGRKAQICEACQLEKQHRLLFPNDRNRGRNKLDLIHSDVWGPTQNVVLVEADTSFLSSTIARSILGSTSSRGRAKSLTVSGT
jgi:hypothetical protein